MSRSHINVLEVGTVKEKSTNGGISIPSTITSHLTLGTTSALKANYIEVSDGGYVELRSNLVQMTGFVATPNITVDQINENNASQGVLATCNLGVTGTKKFSANTIEPASGSTGMYIGATGATISINATDAIFSGNVRTENIYAGTTGVNIRSPLSVWSTLSTIPGSTATFGGDVKITTTAKDTDPNKFLTINSSNVIKYVNPYILLPPAQNYFFDDFTFFMTGKAYDGGYLTSFDKPWYISGEISELTLINFDPFFTSDLTTQNTNGMVVLSYSAISTPTAYFNPSNFSTFNPANGDIYFECAFYCRDPQHIYYDILSIFIGLGKNAMAGIDYNNMDLYTGFRYRNSISSSPNDYFETFYDVTPTTSTAVSTLTSVSLITPSTSTLFKLKMIIKTGTIEYYINGTLVDTATVSFPADTKLGPRISYFLDPSVNASAKPYRGIGIDYVLCYQNYNRSTL